MGAVYAASIAILIWTLRDADFARLLDDVEHLNPLWIATGALAMVSVFFVQGLRWKLILISTPFVFLLMDVLSWWLTKYHPIFAWLTMIGGLGYSVASTVMISTSLIQMWVPDRHWPGQWLKPNKNF